ncbi:MAG: HDOD domain-containing protein [Steroidobacteraceae bacterium]
MPSLWLALPVIAALVAVIWLLARHTRFEAEREKAEGPEEDGLQAAAAVSAQAPRVQPPAQCAPGIAFAASDPDDGGGIAAASGLALTSAEVFAQLHELAFDVAALPPPAKDAYEAIALRCGAALESEATQLRHAPRRPLLLPQLLRAMRNDEVSRRDLAAIISRDPALAGNLLKLANSSFYRVSDRPVESVDRAVVLLGTDGIRSLVATALVQPVFDLAKQAFPRFPEVVWEHTYHSAAAAESHAAIVEDTDPFAAQLLGLTMGLGSIVVFRVALEQYAALPGRSPDPAAIAALLDAHAAQAARRIAGSWQLSERISSALADQIPGGAARERTSLGRSLYCGRLIGALAVLYSGGRVSDEAAKASMPASGASSFQLERIWARLTGKADAGTEPQVNPKRSWWREVDRPKPR